MCKSKSEKELSQSLLIPSVKESNLEALLRSISDLIRTQVENVKLGRSALPNNKDSQNLNYFNKDEGIFDVLDIDSYKSTMINKSEDGYFYSLFYIPVIIENLDSETSFVPFNASLMKCVNDLFSSYSEIETMSLGLGKNKKVKNLLNNEFESLYLLKPFIEKETYNYWENNNHIFLNKDNEIIVPFMSLIAFSQIWKADQTFFFEEYLKYLRTFKAGIEFLRLSNKKYKVVKTTSNFFINPSFDKETINSLSQLTAQHDEYVEDNIGPNNINSIEADKINLTNCEEVMLGTVISIIDWSMNNKTVLKKIIYPITYENDLLIDSMKQEIKENINNDYEFTQDYIDILEESNPTSLLTAIS